MKQIAGGVCARQAFSASGVHCGIRKNKTKRDLALIYSSVPASAAAVYTTNLVKGAPLVVTKQHLGRRQGAGHHLQQRQRQHLQRQRHRNCRADEQSSGTGLHIDPSDVVVASTGVIGQPLDIAPIAAGIPELVNASARTPTRLPRAS